MQGDQGKAPGKDNFPLTFLCRVFQKACKKAAIRTIPRDVPVIRLNTPGGELRTQFLIARNFAGDIQGCEVIVKIIR